VIFDPDTGKLIDPDGLKGAARYGIGRVTHAAYDPSTGEEVSSEKQQRNHLNRQQDEMSARMGYDVTYGQADPTDRSTLGITPDE
jgi:hypothetical protein